MTITRIGVIGGGPLGLAFAEVAARAGIETTVCGAQSEGRPVGPANARPGKVKAATLWEAAEEDIVLLAVDWVDLAGVLSVIADWEGRILLDATDPLLPKSEVANLGGRTSSEVVSEMAPGAQVVKAFNTLPAALLAADPQQAGGRRVIFVSGDHIRAKAEVGRLIRQFGFAAIDLGGLVEGGRLQEAPKGPLRGLNLIRLEE